MNYKEAVEKNINYITGNPEELNRRLELWEKIVNAYEQGGKDEVKRVVSKEGERIIEKFEDLSGKILKNLSGGENAHT